MSATAREMIARYGAREIPLARICEEHFGLSVKLAKERAAKAELPVPAYKVARNGEWLVRADDLAELLDREHARAKDRLAMVQGAA